MGNNVISSSSVKSLSSSTNKDKILLVPDQALGDEWTHDEDYQNGFKGLESIKRDGYMQQTLEATARVKAQRAKEARLEAKKEAIWQQKEAQKQGQEKKKGQQNGASGGGNDNNKDVPINADAERGFTGKFGLTRCLPANLEVSALFLLCLSVCILFHAFLPALWCVYCACG